MRASLRTNSVQFLYHLVGGGGRDIRDNSAEILEKTFLQEALVNSSGMGRDVLLFDVHPAFPLLTVALALKHGF